MQQCPAAPGRAPQCTTTARTGGGGTHARNRYSHFENAAVFVQLAAFLIDKNGGPTSHRRPYSTFIQQPTDPSISNHTDSLTQRIGYGLRCKYPSYVLALLYMRKLKSKQRGFLDITMETFQRIAITAAVVGGKFYDDLYYSNEHYARELGFSLETLNALELAFLVLIDFDLKVHRDHFAAALSFFDKSRIGYCNKDNSKALSGLRTSQLPLDPIILIADHHKIAYRVDDPSIAGNEDESGGSSSSSIDPESPTTQKFAKAEARKLSDYFATRLLNNCRYETEEEYLLKTDIYTRARVMHKLIQQSAADYRRQKDAFLAAAAAAAAAEEQQQPPSKTIITGMTRLQDNALPPCAPDTTLPPAANFADHYAHHHQAAFQPQQVPCEPTTTRQGLGRAGYVPHQVPPPAMESEGFAAYWGGRSSAQFLESQNVVSTPGGEEWLDGDALCGGGGRCSKTATLSGFNVTGEHEEKQVAAASGAGL